MSLNNSDAAGFALNASSLRQHCALCARRSAYYARAREETRQFPTLNCFPRANYTLGAFYLCEKCEQKKTAKCQVLVQRHNNSVFQLLLVKHRLGANPLAARIGSARGDGASFAVHRNDNSTG